MGEWIGLPQPHLPQMRCPTGCLPAAESYLAPIRPNSGQVAPQTRSKIPGEQPAARPILPSAHCEKLGQSFLVVIFNYLL